MSTFLLVHGAWHGAWCWKTLIPLLESDGCRVIAPDLPGHGNDRTPVNDISLDSYVQRIILELEKLEDEVILVGHSMGGIIISEVAERCPEKIKCLVYLTAFLPLTGDSLSLMEKRNPCSAVPPSLIPSVDGLSATVKENRIIDLFYHDCSKDDIKLAENNLCPQALGLLDTPVELSDGRFGRIPRIYIECSEDRALCHEFQKIMINAYPGTETYTLASGHSPFFSMPVKLAEILLSI